MSVTHASCPPPANAPAPGSSSRPTSPWLPTSQETRWAQTEPVRITAEPAVSDFSAVPLVGMNQLVALTWTVKAALTYTLSIEDYGSIEVQVGQTWASWWRRADAWPRVKTLHYPRTRKPSWVTPGTVEARTRLGTPTRSSACASADSGYERAFEF